MHRIRIFLKIYRLRLFLSKTNHQISKTIKVPIFGPFLTLLDKYENYLRSRDNNNKPKRQRRQLLSCRHSGKSSTKWNSIQCSHLMVYFSRSHTCGCKMLLNVFNKNAKTAHALVAIFSFLLCTNFYIQTYQSIFNVIIYCTGWYLFLSLNILIASAARFFN